MRVSFSCNFSCVYVGFFLLCPHKSSYISVAISYKSQIHSLLVQVKQLKISNLLLIIGGLKIFLLFASLANILAKLRFASIFLPLASTPDGGK